MPIDRSLNGSLRADNWAIVVVGASGYLPLLAYGALMSRRLRDLKVLSLFTGAGGLDLGLEAAGFDPVLCVENDPEACETLKHNRPEWQLSDPGDIHELGPRALLHQARLRPRELTLLSGGPPCQPFSKSMYWANGDAPRLRDPRAQTLHAYLDVVAATLPQVLLLENVKGLAFEGKDEGLKLLERGLRKINIQHATRYAPQVITINAADYGVPQHRERIFVLASVDGRQIRMPDMCSGAGDRPRYAARSTITPEPLDNSPARLKTPQIQASTANRLTRLRGQDWTPIGGPCCVPLDTLPAPRLSRSAG